VRSVDAKEEGADADPAAAVALYAAVEDDPADAADVAASRYVLGRRYELGVPPDLEAARRAYAKVAVGGSCRAREALARLDVVAAAAL